jgi:hypothetical protein
VVKQRRAPNFQRTHRPDKPVTAPRLAPLFHSLGASTHAQPLHARTHCDLDPTRSLHSTSSLYTAAVRGTPKNPFPCRHSRLRPCTPCFPPATTTPCPHWQWPVSTQPVHTHHPYTFHGPTSHSLSNQHTALRSLRAALHVRGQPAGQNCAASFQVLPIDVPTSNLHCKTHTP